MHLDVVGQLRQVDVVGVARHREPRLLHGPDEVVADPHLGLRPGRVRVLGDRAQVLAERLGAGQIQETGLAGQLRAGAGRRETGQPGLLRGLLGGRGSGAGRKHGRDEQRDSRASGGEGRWHLADLLACFLSHRRPS
ncbi:MAG: hypothetical protein F4012_06275 [Gemmatimonadales bacterium]|nr:hypothetical protein [Gemmatimonadales bacterium]